MLINYLAPYNKRNYSEIVNFFKLKNIKIHIVLHNFSSEGIEPITSDGVPIFPYGFTNFQPGNIYLSITRLGNILNFADIFLKNKNNKLYISFTIPQYGYIEDFDMNKLKFVIENIFEDNKDKSWLRNSLKYINNYAEFDKNIFLERIKLGYSFLEKKEETYFYKNIRPRPGDIVIDAGAGGENSEVEDYIKIFLRYIKDGKIYAFEPEKKAFINLYEKYKDYKNVEIINKAVSNREDTKYIVSKGSATYITDNQLKADDKIETVSIDNFVKERKIKKVDFIKMDIEGSEYKAILGAKETIKKFKPKLAICVYHHPKDLYEIPLLIKNINPEYKIYFRINELVNFNPLVGAKIFAY